MHSSSPPQVSTHSPADKRSTIISKSPTKAIADIETSSPAAPEGVAADLNPETTEFVEGGLETWRVVFGCALVSISTVGWNLIWGVFETYHADHMLKGTSDAQLSAVGAVQNSLMTFLSFIFGKLGDRYGYKRFIGAGCILVFIGMLLSAFSHEYWSILVTQGVMHGLGCGLLLPLIFSIPSQWTQKHRGLATGIVVAGASLGGAVPSLIVQEMLTRMGFHKTMLIYSFVQGAVMLAGVLLIKTRRPPSSSKTIKKRIQWIETRYSKDPMFWSFWLSIVFAVYGYMNAFIYIAVYTHEKLPELPSRLYNLPITVMSFASVIGRTTVGFAADRIGSVNAFVLVVFTSSLCQAVLWNVAAESYAGIMVFSALFGLSGPCFISLVTPVAATLYGIENLATLTRTLNLANVPGNLSGPPIGGAILDHSGRNWHALTAYSGTAQFIGMVFMLYVRFSQESRLFAKL